MSTPLSTEVEPETFVHGFREAYARLAPSVGDMNTPPEDAFLPLFETLNWAAALSHLESAGRIQIDVVLEESRVMQVQLGTHGSPEVSDAYRAFGESLREFAQRVDDFRLIRTGEDAQGDLADAGGKMEEARGKVREALRTLERLVSDELAGF
jgi:hypothetical protein